VLASGVNLGAVGEESEVPVPAGSLPSEVLGSWTLATPSLVEGGVGRAADRFSRSEAVVETLRMELVDRSRK
jgi:hypothetical protein